MRMTDSFISQVGVNPRKPSSCVFQHKCVSLDKCTRAYRSYLCSSWWFGPAAVISVVGPCYSATVFQVGHQQHSLCNPEKGGRHLTCRPYQSAFHGKLWVFLLFQLFFISGWKCWTQVSSMVWTAVEISPLICCADIRSEEVQDPARRDLGHLEFVVDNCMNRFLGDRQLCGDRPLCSSSICQDHVLVLVCTTFEFNSPGLHVL